MSGAPADEFAVKRERITRALEVTLSSGSTTAEGVAEGVAAVRDALVGDEATAEGAAELKAQTAERASTLELVLRTFLESRLGESKRPGASLASVGVTALLDLALALSAAGVADHNACFCLLEDLFDTLVISEADQLWKLVEARAAALSPLLSDTPEKSTRAKLTLIRTCNELLRRLSKSKNTNFCGRILMLLSYVLPLSDRSGVNIKGISATSQLDVDETEDGVQDMEQDSGANGAGGAEAANGGEASASVRTPHSATYPFLYRYSHPPHLIRFTWPEPPHYLYPHLYPHLHPPPHAPHPTSTPRLTPASPPPPQGRRQAGRRPPASVT